MRNTDSESGAENDADTENVVVDESADSAVLDAVKPDARLRARSRLETCQTIIIMVIFKCYFSREHTALSYKKWCEHRIRKNQQTKSIAHDGRSYLK